jgi:hypothetical protein
MTLQKQVDDLSRDNRLLVASSGVVSVKRLNASNQTNYYQVGPTVGGFEVFFQSDIEYFGDDATNGPVGGLVIGESARLRFSLSQGGMFNLSMAMNYNNDDHIDITQPVVHPPSDGQIQFKAGGRRDLEEYEIKVQIKSASGQKIREYIFYKAVPAPDFSQRYMDGSRTLVECNFVLLMDISKSESERYFTVVDYVDSDYGQIVPPAY